MEFRAGDRVIAVTGPRIGDTGTVAKDSSGLLVREAIPVFWDKNFDGWHSYTLGVPMGHGAHVNPSVLRIIENSNNIVDNFKIGDIVVINKKILKMSSASILDGLVNRVFKIKEIKNLRTQYCNGVRIPIYALNHLKK